MSAIALLMGLLVLSYIGSLIVGGRAARGLPSGVEFVGLGFVVGPHALGLVERGMIAEFEPIVQVALGWLAFVVGLDFGRAGRRRVRTKPLVIGVLCAVFTGAIVAVAVHRLLLARAGLGLDKTSVGLLAAGAGAVSAETTRFVVQWVAVRSAVKGPVSSTIVDIAAADDFAPLVAAGAIFAFVPASGTSVTLSPGGWFVVSVLLGGLLGTVTALLLRGAEGYAVWGALIGTLLLGVGVSMRFGLCTIFVTFVMGIALARVSPSRRTLRALVGATEHAVLYPMLLLAGARLDPQPWLGSRLLLSVVGLALVGRVVGKWLSGLVVRMLLPAVRPAGKSLGLVLLSSGPVSISCGFLFALRFPGRVGDTLLFCAVASAVLGELVSTMALKRLLVRVGELTAPVVAPLQPEPQRRVDPGAQASDRSSSDPPRAARESTPNDAAEVS